VRQQQSRSTAVLSQPFRKRRNYGPRRLSWLENGPWPRKARLNARQCRVNHPFTTPQTRNQRRSPRRHDAGGRAHPRSHVARLHARADGVQCASNAPTGTGMPARKPSFAAHSSQSRPAISRWSHSGPPVLPHARQQRSTSPGNPPAAAASRRSTSTYGQAQMEEALERVVNAAQRAATCRSVEDCAERPRLSDCSQPVQQFGESPLGGIRAAAQSMAATHALRLSVICALRATRGGRTRGSNRQSFELGRYRMMLDRCTIAYRSTRCRARPPRQRLWRARQRAHVLACDCVA